MWPTLNPIRIRNPFHQNQNGVLSSLKSIFSTLLLVGLLLFPLASISSQEVSSSGVATQLSLPELLQLYKSLKVTFATQLQDFHQQLTESINQLILSQSQVAELQTKYNNLVEANKALQSVSNEIQMQSQALAQLSLDLTAQLGELKKDSMDSKGQVIVLTSQFNDLIASTQSLIAFSKAQQEKIKLLEGTVGVLVVGVGVGVAIQVGQFVLTLLKK